MKSIEIARLLAATGIGLGIGYVAGCLDQIKRGCMLCLDRRLEGSRFTPEDAP